MEKIIGFCVLCILVALLGIQFKTAKPEFGFYLGLALSLILLGLILDQVTAWMGRLGGLLQALGETKGYLAILIKVLGITYLCDYSASLCKDAGYGAMAGQLEILGKVAVLSTGLPVFIAVIEILQKLLA